MPVLEAERDFFESNKSDLIAKHEGLFALVQDHRLIGTFPTAEDAYVEGLTRFGTAPFLVKQIVRDEPVAFVPVFSVAYCG